MFAEMKADYQVSLDFVLTESEMPWWLPLKVKVPGPIHRVPTLLKYTFGTTNFASPDDTQLAEMRAASAVCHVFINSGDS